MGASGPVPIREDERDSAIMRMQEQIDEAEEKLVELEWQRDFLLEIIRGEV